VKLPGLEELLTLRAAARALSLRAQGPARALLLGSHRSALQGRGAEVEEVRPYVAGDDARSIDWRVTARRARVHTKLFREERERPVWLLVDLGPSMFFGSKLQLKSMAAVRAAALLAWAAALGGDRVGALISNARSARVLPMRSREAGVLPILNALIELQPSAPTASTHRRAAPLRALMPLVRPGSLILAFSDFQSLDADMESDWTALSAHSDCRWLWITDPLEVHALPEGRFVAGFAGRTARIDGAAVRSRWLDAWAARAGRIDSFTSGRRISLTRLDTGQPVVESLATSLHAAKSAA
jgi:uncharacterized protein (DUF58 family)